MVNADAYLYIVVEANNVDCETVESMAFKSPEEAQQELRAMYDAILCLSDIPIVSSQINEASYKVTKESGDTFYANIKKIKVWSR